MSLNLSVLPRAIVFAHGFSILAPVQGLCSVETDSIDI